MDNNYLNANYENSVNTQTNQKINGQVMPAMYQETNQPTASEIKTPFYRAYQNDTLQFAGTQMSENEYIPIQDSKKAINDIESKRPMFALWNVGGNTYRLKLKTQAINELEKKYKVNLLSLMGSETGLPALSVMLDITHAAISPWHNGIKFSNIEAMFDIYVDEGGSQFQFFKDIYLDIFKASGFFSKEMLEDMKKI